MSEQDDYKLRRYNKTQVAAAKCILGPRFDLPPGVHTLDSIRDQKWNSPALSFERQDALNAAAAIMRDFHLIPRKKRISNFSFSKDRQEREHFLKTKKAKKDAAGIPAQADSEES